MNNTNKIANLDERAEKVGMRVYRSSVQVQSNAIIKGQPIPEFSLSGHGCQMASDEHHFCDVDAVESFIQQIEATTPA